MVIQGRQRACFQGGLIVDTHCLESFEVLEIDGVKKLEIRNALIRYSFQESRLCCVPLFFFPIYDSTGSMAVRSMPISFTRPRD